MSVVEFIGFIVSLIAMILLMGTRLWQEAKRRRNPQPHEDEDHQAQPLKDLLESLDKRHRHQQPPPTPVPQAKKPKTPYPAQQPLPQKPKRSGADKFAFKSSLDDRHHETAIEKRSYQTSIKDPYQGHIEEDILSTEFRKSESSAYDIIHRRHLSQASKIIHGLPSAKDMLVIKEIFGPPKSLRLNPWLNESDDVSQR